MQRDVEASAPVGRAGDAVAKAHAELLRDRGFQFDRADFQPPKTPEWLKWIGEAFQAIAPLLKYVFWIGVALIAALVLYALVREVLMLRMPAAKPRTAQADAAAEWRPDAAAARDLLVAADLLAAEGRYAEAAHLILLRSAAGRSIPMHSHGQNELTMILQGAYDDTLGHFAPGDVADLDCDIEHQPVTAPGVPCICVAATDAPLRFSSWLARMLQPLFRL